MQGFRLAVYTFNQFVAPYESEQIKGFRDAEPATMLAIEGSEGFIARSGYGGDDGLSSWGEQVFPKCWTNDNGDDWAPSTLSLWASVETIMAATYHGLHRQVLKQGKGWHIRADHIPEYVLWWVREGDAPDWTQAVQRFEMLLDHGAQPNAFSFSKLFDPLGSPIKPDMERVKQLAQLNAEFARKDVAAL
ncbi:DUF3291 domain-containing protein [Rhodobacteraceae bacterium RKSG542]|uniref:DUF3291 domain-containing protein n=1 Tax=Pseudovibrio flavus TaxID=2529854 RepID=UPI0012BB7122|nr:DUF3291 domain-containing protein [Pseudovibrio flavus]MTI16451.1 DUF3291 domain-containing protein [Pseudovibrio flavus]